MQKYSVLMTMYIKDNPDYAKLAIDSMLNQTVKTDDFVIVCDGPLNDELNQLISFYQTQYNFFNIVRLPQNVGLGAALREGVLVCKNLLIARMDDDDVAKENRCELELKEFEKDDKLSICGSYMNEFDSDIMNPIRIKEVPTEFEHILAFSKRRNPFNHSTVMFKKEDILSIGNYSPMRTNQDVDLWVRALNNKLKGINISQPLVDFRFDSNTYQRRKEWKNVKLLIDVWRNFHKEGYCTLTDYWNVKLVQVMMFALPKRVVQWCYDHLR